MPRVRSFTENTNFLKANIKRQMEYHDITPQALCKACKISESTLRLRFRKPYDVTFGELTLMAGLFGCSVEQLINKNFK